MTVYIMALGAADPPDLVKVGFSTDPTGRLEALQAAHHEPLRIIRLIDGGSATERWMHLRFKDLRVNREWFTFSPEMLAIEPPPEPPAAASRPVRADAPRQLPIGECFVCKRIGPIDDDRMCANGAEHAALLDKAREEFVRRLIRTNGPGGVERTIATVEVPNAEYRAALRDLFAEETRKAGLEPVVGPLDMTDYGDGELDDHFASRMSKMVTVATPLPSPSSVACALCERPLLVRPDPAARAWLCADCSAHPVLVQHFREGRARLAEGG